MSCLKIIDKYATIVGTGNFYKWFLGREKSDEIPSTFEGSWSDEKA